MTYPVTPHLGLPLVPDGDTAWGPAMREAMTTLDGAVNSASTAAAAAQNSADTAATNSAAAQTAASSATSTANEALITADLAHSTAVATAQEAPVVVTGLPALPDAAYPASKLVYDTTTKRLYRSTGSAWESATVDATSITGTLADAQIAAMAAAKVTGTLTDAQLAAISAAKVTGQLVSTQISDAAITDAKIAGMAASKVTGTLTDAQLAAISAAKVTGQLVSTQISDAAITDAKIAGMAASKVTGTLTDAQLAAISAAKVTGQLVSTQITDGIISTAKIAANAVTAAQIAADTITAAQIAAGAVTASELAAGAVVAGKIAAGTIQAADIAAGTITGDRLAANTVTASQIAANTVTAAQIAADTITAAQIAAGAVTASELAAGAVVAGKIAAGTIQAADIAAGTITGDRLAANTVTASQIAANTVTAAQIAADTITAAQIAANAVTASELAAGAVVAGKIAAGTIQAADIAASTITGDRLAANTVTAAQIAANTITAGQISADTITAGQIAAGAIGASELAAQSVFASNMTVVNLDNLIPNANSEMDPSTIPVGAVEGNGVSGSAGSRFRVIMGAGPGATGRLQISPEIPMMPGEQYLLSWEQAGNYQTGSAAVNCGMEVYMAGTDAWNTAVGYGFPQYIVDSYSWKPYSVAFTIPSGAARSMHINMISYNLPTYSSMIFRKFYLRRMADASLIVDGCITTAKLNANAIQTTNYTQDGSGNPTAGARMDISSVAFKVASGNFQIGTYIFTDYWFRLLQAIDGSLSGGVVVVRGNIDTSTNGGTPNINRLGLYGWGSAWDGSCSRADYEYEILPTNTLNPASDNIEALSHLLIKVCTASGSPTPLMTRKIQLGWGRTFKVTASNNYGNTHCGSFTLFKRGTNFCGGTNNQSTLWMRCSLFNAYGQSAERDYSPTTGADGTALGNSAITGLGGTAGSSGGGATGGYCPAPWVKIQLASGLLIDAADLYDGAQVLGADEETLEPMIGIVRNPRIRWTERMPIHLADGRVTEFSPPHRLLVIGKGWTEIRNLQPGDSIMAQHPSIVQALGKAALAQVVSFTVEGCSTYFADGLLAHNLKPA